MTERCDSKARHTILDLRFKLQRLTLPDVVFGELIKSLEGHFPDGFQARECGSLGFRLTVDDEEHVFNAVLWKAHLKAIEGVVSRPWLVCRLIHLCFQSCFGFF